MRLKIYYIPPLLLQEIKQFRALDHSILHYFSKTISDLSLGQSSQHPNVRIDPSGLIKGPKEIFPLRQVNPCLSSY